MVTAEALSISDAANATGLSVHTLRYYERAGLMLDPVERAPSSHRRYTEDEIRWVTLLTRLRATGMPIRRIRDYADLVRAGDGNEDERLALLEAHRDGGARAARGHAREPRRDRVQDRALPRAGLLTRRAPRRERSGAGGEAGRRPATRRG